LVKELRLLGRAVVTVPRSVVEVIEK
jgi:hypothetical protein